MSCVSFEETGAVSRDFVSLAGLFRPDARTIAIFAEAIAVGRLWVEFDFCFKRFNGVAGCVGRYRRELDDGMPLWIWSPGFEVEKDESLLHG